MKNWFVFVLILFFAIGVSKFLAAPSQKEARVTIVVKDVRLLNAKAARPAAVNDNVNEGTGVRTGQESRAELTFTDQTLARLGENSVFTFSEGAKNFDLSSGAMLLAVPKSAGTARVHIGAATAAVSGFTAMVEHHKSINKLIILEGHGTVSFKGVHDSCDIRPGQMMIWPEHPTVCPQAYYVDLNKVTKSAKLITKFPRLPSWLLIEQEIAQQEANPPTGGYVDPTGSDKVDQSRSARPPSPPIMHHSPPPSPPPSRF
jgi:mannose-6-phosphate isomerase-like protein (cupin superfamily)